MHLLFWHVKWCLLKLRTLTLELVKAKPRTVEFFSSSFSRSVNWSNFPSKGSMIMLHGKGFYFITSIPAVTSHSQTTLLPADRCVSSYLLGLLLHRNQRRKKEELENSTIRNHRLPPSTIHHSLFSFLTLQRPWRQRLPRIHVSSSALLWGTPNILKCARKNMILWLTPDWAYKSLHKLHTVSVVRLMNAAKLDQVVIQRVAG